MATIDGPRLVRMFDAIADALEAEKDRLCALDGVIGDADHGIAMALGFAAVRKTLATAEPQAEPAAVLNTAARAFLSAVGASSGPLYATALMRAAAAVKGKAELAPADVGAMVEAMARGIEERGKATVGEKTMVDAWAPAATAIAAATRAGDGVADGLAAAVAAARQGAEATKDMLAGKGRASRLGERALGHVDPGAASAVVVLETMAKSLSG